MGRPKRHRKSVGCYVIKERAIYVSSKGHLNNPYVILHEFYHHLRTIDGEHRGVEKYANKFARDYVSSFVKLLLSS